MLKCPLQCLFCALVPHYIKMMPFFLFTPAPSNILSPPLAVPVTNYVGVLEETSAAECDGVITITVELLNAQTRP